MRHAPSTPWALAISQKQLPGGGGVMVQKIFCVLRNVFDVQYKNTSNLSLLSFKVSSERFFQKVLKTF